MRGINPGYNQRMMRMTLACWVAMAGVAIAQPASKAPPPAPAPTSANQPCGDAACGAPALVKTPVYSAHIERNGRFSAEVTIDQPCRCTRNLTLLMAFTPPATTATKERLFKLKVAPGVTTTPLSLSAAELAATRVVPGRYAITFALYDERDRLAGDPLSGNPFSFGSAKITLPSRPALPPSIGREAPLDVPFEFKNDGDTASPATALLVFTRPGGTKGIEYYVRDLMVAPGGARHVVSMPPDKRRALGVGPGAWLVTATAFDGAGERMASYAGNVLTIGTVQLSLSRAPNMSAVIEARDDFKVNLTVENRGDAEDEFTAVLIFTRAELEKPIEQPLGGLRAAPGFSKHPLVLSAQQRAELGIGKGVWQVAVTALDRSGKRLETHRGHDLVIR